jgi:hypothetical protein
MIDYGIETWRYCLSFRIRPRNCSSQLSKSSNGYLGHPSRGICRPTSADNGIRAVSHFFITLASALSCFRGPDTTGSLLSTNIRTAIALGVHTSTVQLVLSTPEITRPLRRNNQSGSSGSSWRIQTSLKSTLNGITPSSTSLSANIFTRIVAACILLITCEEFCCPPSNISNDL